jgi:hypothetical protein
MEWIDRAIKICEETGMMAMANSAKNTAELEENYYTVLIKNNNKTKQNNNNDKQ